MSRLNSSDVRSLLSHECGFHGVHLKLTSIAHLLASYGGIGISIFTDGLVVQCYYGTFMYQCIVNALIVHGLQMSASWHLIVNISVPPQYEWQKKFQNRTESQFLARTLMVRLSNVHKCPSISIRRRYSGR